MGKFHLLLSAALAVFTVTDAAVPTGSTLRIKQRSKKYVDQIRVLTKPRSNYNPARDTPSIWDYNGNQCTETTATDFVGPIDSQSKCCKKDALDGITVWAEREYTVQPGDGIKAEDQFLDPTASNYPKPGSCKKRRHTTGKNTTPLPVGSTFNSFMVQAWGKNDRSLDEHALIEFHNQDVVALIWATGYLDDSDEFFAINGDKDIYKDVRVQGGRGFEAGTNEIYDLNCESTRPSKKTCSVGGQMCAQVWGDPHMVTFDKLKYDCQGRGEFVLLKSTAPADPLAIHGVFKDTGGSKKNPSVTRSVAIQVVPGVPVLHVSIPDMPVNGQCPFSYSVQTTMDPINDVVRYFAVNYPGQVDVMASDKAVIVQYPEVGARVEITVHSGRFSSFGCRLRAKACISPAEHGGANAIVGLMGSPNGNTNDDWMQNPDKYAPIPLPNGRPKKAGTGYCIDQWCVPKNQTLYTHNAYDNHNKCCDGNFTAFDQQAYDNIFNNVPPSVVTSCNQMSDNPQECINDVGVAVDQDPNLNFPDLVVEIAGEEQISDDVSETRESDVEDGSSGWTTPKDIGGSSRGDPHFKTWHNEHFEFHGQCDMVLARDPTFAGDVGLDVHVRTKLVRFWSYIKTAAIRIGNDILEIEGSPEIDDHETHYWFNYEYQGDAPTIGGFPLSIKRSGFQKRFFEIDLSSKFPGQKIVISTFREFVSVDFKHASVEAYGNSVGMLGDFMTGETLARDGQTVLNDFSVLGNEWQVLPSDGNLFHTVSEPQYPRACVMPEDPRGDRRRRLGESDISVEEAEAACAKVVKDVLDIKDCVYDILATQDLDMVGAF